MISTKEQLRANASFANMTGALNQVFIEVQVVSVNTSSCTCDCKYIEKGNVAYGVKYNYDITLNVGDRGLVIKAGNKVYFVMRIL